MAAVLSTARKPSGKEAVHTTVPLRDFPVVTRKLIGRVRED